MDENRHKVAEGSAAIRRRNPPAEFGNKMNCIGWYQGADKMRRALTMRFFFVAQSRYGSHLKATLATRGGPEFCKR
jgi:hypothetical protein